MSRLKPFTGLVLRCKVNNQLAASFVTTDGEEDDACDFYTKAQGLEYLERVYLRGIEQPDERRVGAHELQLLLRDISLCPLPNELPYLAVPIVMCGGKSTPKQTRWRVSILTSGWDDIPSKQLPC